ncbi:MAG: DUF882 domain-containing protein [Vicinamibacterales bacterium]
MTAPARLWSGSARHRFPSLNVREPRRIERREEHETISRRAFLSTLAAGVPLLASPRSGRTVHDATLQSRTSCAPVAHTHTGEHLDVENFTDGAYLPDALATVNRLLRDFRTGDVHPIDKRLLDLLHELQFRTETTKPFEIISALSVARHERLPAPATAAVSLRRAFTSRDRRSTSVSATFRCLNSVERPSRPVAGGVGFYPGSDFVHVDTGRVRTW